MGMMKEFRAFAMRGNVVDLAVGVVIGAAFGKIVSSMVEKIFMPLLGLVVGSVDFSKMGATLRAASGDKPALVLGYGSFIQAVIDFVIIAFAIFMVVKGMNKLQHKEEAKPAAPPEPPADVKLLGEIRDLLKAQGAR